MDGSSDESPTWCRITVVDPEGNTVSEQVLTGTGDPNADVVDEIARAALTARRAGLRVKLEPSEKARELLELAGLTVELEWEAERREEPFRIHEREEEAHRGDLPA